MKKIRALITHLLNGLAGLSLLAMVTLTCWQVFTRYLLHAPSTWSEELVGYLFAWASLLGASLVAGERGHVSIPIFVDSLGPRGQKIMNCLGELIGLLFAAIILVAGGIKITSLGMGQMTSSLGVQIGIFYAVMPLCGVLIVIYAVLNIIDILRK